MINKVILIGNLGKDPELKQLQGGQSVCSFSLATSESYKDKQGEWQEKTEWHNVTCWGLLAERADKLSKGEKVYIEGKITTRKWQDKDGNDRYSTEIVANSIRRVSPKINTDVAPSAATPQAASVPEQDDWDAPF